MRRGRKSNLTTESVVFLTYVIINAFMRKKIPRNVWILTITSLLTDISTEMIVNVLPLFLYNVLGVRTSVIGLIDGVAETTASLVKIVSGNLSDRLGKRKQLAVLGYGMSALTKPLFYFANSWGWVLGIRFTDRVGKGIRTAPRDSLIAGSISPEQRGLAFGLHRAGDTLGAFIGLGLAALIIWLTQSGAAELSRQTFQTIVLVSMIPAFLGVLILGLGAREVTISEHNQGAKVSYAWRSLDLRFRRFLGVVLIFTLGNSSDAFIILRGQERGLSVLQVMLMVRLI
jgi:sugar phosphate permease